MALSQAQQSAQVMDEVFKGGIKPTLRLPHDTWTLPFPNLTTIDTSNKYRLAVGEKKYLRVAVRLQPSRLDKG
jgi:hypothetical protein